ITYRSTLEETNEIWAVITGFANQQFDLARIEGRHEPEDAFFRRRSLARWGRLGQRRIYWRSTCERGANAEFALDNVRASGRKPKRWPPIRRCRPHPMQARQRRRENDLFETDPFV